MLVQEDILKLENLGNPKQAKKLIAESEAIKARLQEKQDKMLEKLEAFYC